MTLADLNRLPFYRAEEEFLRCSNSKAWARAMARRRPFSNPERLLKAAEEIWRSLGEAEEQNKFTLWRLKQLFPQ